jgi:hypothetical protein
VGLVALLFVAVFVKHVGSGLILLTMMAVYLALGLSEELLFFRRRREEEAATRAQSTASPVSEGGARSDEEVLAALGAYDDVDTNAPESSPRP